MGIKTDFLPGLDDFIVFLLKENIFSTWLKTEDFWKIGQERMRVKGSSAMGLKKIFFHFFFYFFDTILNKAMIYPVKSSYLIVMKMSFFIFQRAVVKIMAHII